MRRSIRTVLGVGSIVTVFAVTSLIATPSAWAQQKAGAAQQQIVGVWKLLSSINTGADGATKTGSFGPTPKGTLIFTSSGHYSSVNTDPNIPKFASGSRLTGTPEENKAVVQRSIAHFGTYSVSADGKVLTLNVEGSTWAHWNGQTQKRELTLSGDDMKYSVTASTTGKSVLTYKRVK